MMNMMKRRRRGMMMLMKRSYDERGGGEGGGGHPLHLLDHLNNLSWRHLAVPEGIQAVAVAAVAAAAANVHILYGLSLR